MTAPPIRAGGQPSWLSARGQVGVLTLALLAAGLSVSFLALAAGRAAVERARAQRVADTAALAGALRLARDPLDTAAALAAARRVVEAAGDEALAVALRHDVVEVRVRRPRVVLRLPALVGGTAALRVQAVARAAPGEPPSPPPLPRLDGAGGSVGMGSSSVEEPDRDARGGHGPGGGTRLAEASTAVAVAVEADVPPPGRDDDPRGTGARRPGPVDEAAGPPALDAPVPSRRGEAPPPDDPAPAVPDGPAVPDESGASTVPAWVPPPFRAAFASAAVREGLPTVLLAAQAEAESGFRSDAVSPAGAVGIAQFMPATWAGSWNPWRGRSPREPEAAIAAQGRYLRRLLDAHDGRIAVALAAYNAGSSRARLPPAAWPAETRAYVSRILARVAGGGPGRAPAWPAGWDTSAAVHLVG